jgi:sirohydrochlorin ferrochelatase
LLAVAHGSKDPRATATIAALMSLVRERAAQRALPCPAPPPAGDPAAARLADLPGFAVEAAFLGHCAPSLADALSQLAAGRAPAGGVPRPGRSGDQGCWDRDARPIAEVTIVPLLLAAAYHAATDIPAQLEAASAALPWLRVRQAAALGPHPLLLAAAERRLAQALPPGQSADQASVVLAAAGSSDPRANAQVAALAAQWQQAGRWRRVVPAYASAAFPTPAEAVRALSSGRGDHSGRGQVVVATYLLAPGYFADKVREQARQAGARAVSAPLGAAPEVADVIIDRYLDAVRGPVPTPALARSDGSLDGGAPRSGRTPLRMSLSWALTITRTRRDSRGCDDVNTLTRER